MSLNPTSNDNIKLEEDITIKDEDSEDGDTLMELEIEPFSPEAQRALGSQYIHQHSNDIISIIQHKVARINTDESMHSNDNDNNISIIQHKMGRLNTDESMHSNDNKDKMARLNSDESIHSYTEVWQVIYIYIYIYTYTRTII